MNSLTPHFLPMLLSLLAKMTLLLLAALLACRMLPRSSAAVRHLIWTAALVSLLLLPLLSMSLPTWQLAWGHAAAAVPAPAVTPVPASAPEALPPSILLAPPAHSPDTLSVASPPVAASVIWADTIFCLWLMGVLAVMTHFAVGLWRIQQIKRQSVPLAQPQQSCAEAAWQQMGLRRPVIFLRSLDCHALAIPVTWGVFRPIVLLPAQSQDWSGDCLRAALLHELAHIRRGDWPTQVLARITCALYWWHPLVWRAARQARAEGERASDDLVLGTGMPASDYAQRLVEVVRSLPDGAPTRTVAVAMAQPLEVEGRVRAVLAKGRNRRPLGRLTVIGLGVFLIFCLAPLAALTPVRPAHASGKTSLSRKGAKPLFIPMIREYQPWQTVASEDIVQVAGGSHSSCQDYEVTISPPFQDKAGLAFTVSLRPNYQGMTGEGVTRLVAIDFHRRCILPKIKFCYAGGGTYDETMEFPRLRLTEIASLELQERPYYSFERDTVQSQQYSSNSWNWIAVPADATTEPLTFQDRENGKLLCVIHAARGYDPATETLIMVTITHYYNGRADATVCCDEMYMDEGFGTCSFWTNSPISLIKPNGESSVLRGRTFVMKLGEQRLIITSHSIPSSSHLKNKGGD